MPIIDTPAGTLEVQNAILSASEFRATQKIGVANSAPTKNFSVGDKLHVSTTDLDAVSISGNLVAQKVKVGNLLVSPTFDLASVSNVGNTTSNIIQFANATTGFTTTANVEIGGNISFTSNAQVKVDSNVVAEYTGPHPRRKSPTIKKYPEINFRWENFDADEGDSSSNTYTQGGYQAISSSVVVRSSVGDAAAISRAVWRLFDSFPSDGINLPTGEQYSYQGWMSVAGSYTSTTGLPTGPTRFTDDQGEWVEIVMPKKIQLHRFSIRPAADPTRHLPEKARFPKVFAIHGYNGSAWTRLGEFTSQEVSGGDFSVQSFDIATPTSYYNKFVLVVKQTWSGSLGVSYGTSSVTQFDEWKLFGIEEDAPAGDVSLDTTLKSVYNVPETTNYKMYFDGKDPANGNVPKNLVSGSSLTVTPYNATFDTTNNCWTLNGSMESNVTTGSLGLEGDAPHTVSMWFNASNLENNTYTQQLFSLGSETRESKEIIRVDDTQIASNTWHNLTYAYEGRGGSKVTYLDGHKISEENAVDSFGAYPQIKMRGHDEEFGKTQGFTVNASSTFNGYRIWEIFDGNNITGTGQEGAGAGWASDIASGRPGYNASGVQQRNLSHHTGSALGEWVQIDMPHTLFLDSLDIQSRAESSYAQGGTNWTGFPKNVYLYGSNDNSNWSLIKNFTTTSKHQGENHNQIINNTTAYKHFAMVINTTWVYGSGGQPTWTSIGQLRFWGHKEGDITRFPVPSRTVVYPQTGWPIITYEGYSGNLGSPINPVPFLGLGEAGNAYRGVVVSASSRYDVNQNQPYYAIRKDTGYKWASATGTYNSSNFAAVGSNLGTDNGGTAVATAGEWLMIELPRKIKLQHTLIISPDNANEVPDKFVIYGTNDLTGAWSVVDNTYQSNEANIGTGHGGKHWTVSTASGSNYYKYFGLVITHINGGATLTAIDQWELRGVESDTGVPAVVGGPFDGKIANFRVYDKFLGEERIKEIYDVDKDAFNHKTSSATFYRGRIGVGTTEPEGALAVLDEPPTLEKFPARALDANESYVEGQGYFKITNSVRGGDANTGFGTSDAATGSNADHRQPRPGDNGYLAFGEDNVNHTTLSYNDLYPRAQIGAGSGAGTFPTMGQVGGRYKNFGEGWEEYLKRKKFISAPGHNTRMAEGVDFGAWLKMETPDTMLLKKVKIEASREWAMVGNSIRGDVRLDQLGEAVGINGDGTRVAVSSAQSGSTSGASATNRGKVQVFEYDGWGWTPLGAAIQGDAGTGWYFGSGGCELNGKGDVLIVGSPLDGNGGISARGRVNVYYLKQSPSTGERSWSTKGSQFYGPSANDSYGDGVAISEDGNIIAFGASGINNGSTQDTGGVFVYYWSTSTSAWVQRGTTLFGDEASRKFGGQGNVEMSSDGKYVIFGSRFSLDNDGKVMVWEFGGTNYSQRGSTLDGGTNRFGGSVGISDDGNTIVVGEHLDDAMGTDGGAIHVYNWNSGSSSYTFKQSLHHPSSTDDQAGDRFGQFVCMSGDGKRIVAGSSRYPGDGANARGKLYTFEYDGNSWDLVKPWQMYGMIGERDDVPGDHGVAATNDEGGTSSVYHGSHIAMTRDGSTVIFGMRRANMPNEEFAMRWGLAQVFQITSSIKGIWGSNDDRNWTKLTSTSKTFRSTDMAEFNSMNHTTYYKYHAIIGDAYTSLKKLEFYGIRAKSQSKLHDGELTLTKNLRVPRIGAPHDLDRTPKREHLLVEYNTSTNPMLNGKVIDSSGNEHHGYMHGGIYDADAKCFTFNTGDTRHGGDATGRRKGAYDTLEGTSYGDRLISKLIHTGGRPNLSFSVWVNPKAIDTGSNSVWMLGSPTNQNSIGYRIDRRSQDGRIRHRIYTWDGQSMYRNFLVNCHEWMHVVIVHHAHRFARDNPYGEGPWDLYVNGEYLSSGGTNSGSTLSDLNLARNPVLALGSQVYPNQDIYGTNTSYHGSISNFKLYNCALDENDVKALYDMGRLDEGYDTVSMSKTRVGVGIGDGQAPTTGLDVRSGLRIPTQLTESGGYFMGKMRFNTVTQKLQVHNGNMWLSVGGNIAASGGNNIFTLGDQNAGGTGRLDSDGGRRYRVHAFTSSGTFTANGDLSNVDVLIVAGGGGGGTDNAGGGGAGGLILRPGMNIANGDHAIVVGSGGGAGGPAQSVNAGKGGDSSAFGLSAIGGGRGLNGDGNAASDNNGGSGGGGDGENSATTRGEAMQPGSDSNPAIVYKGGRPSGSAVSESALYGFGHSGGSRNNGAGGGGGGAGQPGGIGSSQTDGIGGEGGDGLYQVVNLPNYPGVWNFKDMFGTTYGHSANNQQYFAGGGGGGNQNTYTNDVAGGLGGGGAARGSDATVSNTGSNPNESGTDNTGGGGAGSTYDGNRSADVQGGRGGSGIVLIRYPL